VYKGGHEGGRRGGVSVKREDREFVQMGLLDTLLDITNGEKRFSPAFIATGASISQEDS
jgi:hypothetical protein